jgi:hypothetical protein
VLINNYSEAILAIIFSKYVRRMSSFSDTIADRPKHLVGKRFINLCNGAIHNINWKLISSLCQRITEILRKAFIDSRAVLIKPTKAFLKKLHHPKIIKAVFAQKAFKRTGKRLTTSKGQPKRFSSKYDLEYC